MVGALDPQGGVGRHPLATRFTAITCPQPPLDGRTDDEFERILRSQIRPAGLHMHCLTVVMHFFRSKMGGKIHLN